MIFGFAFRAWDNARMVAYTIHEQPEPTTDRIDRADELVFVKDGFVWSAALFAPIWLLVNRMWLSLFGYIIAVVGISSVLSLLGAGEQIISLAILAIHVLVGFEADTLKRWTLEQYGWGMIGTVMGRNLSECERRFFDEWLPSQPVLRTSHTSMPGAVPTPAPPHSPATAPAYSAVDDAVATPGPTVSAKRSWTSWTKRGQKA